MVYYYEIVNKPLTSKNLPDETCPVCNKKGTVQVTLYMSYVSMLIPIMGTGRRTSAHCTSCNHVIKPGLSSLADKIQRKWKYSDTIATACKELRDTHRRTAWQLLYPWSFFLVFLSLILVALGAKGVKQFNANKQAKILANPQAGDLYKSMWDEDANRQRKGALVKVVRVSGDTLVVVHTKDMIDGIDIYSQQGWDKLSSSDGAFDPKEYKVQLASFLSSKDFKEFNTKRQIPFGYVLVGNYAFDAVERK